MITETLIEPTVKEWVPRSNPSVYIACLSAYVNGFLHGRWIDATLGYDNMMDEIKEIFASSPEPGDEWAIHDYENFEGIRLSEYENLEHVCALAEALFESDSPEMFAGIYNHLGTENVESVKEFIDENYRGTYTSLEDFAYEMCDECGDLSLVPKHLQYYVDFASLGRDMDWSGDIFTISTNQGLCVFWNNAVH